MNRKRLPEPIRVSEGNIAFVSSVRNLGFTMTADIILDNDRHVVAICLLINYNIAMFFLYKVLVVSKGDSFIKSRW